MLEHRPPVAPKTLVRIVNGTNDKGSTPEGRPDRLVSGAELEQLCEATVSFIEGMATAKAAWDAALRDDHTAEQWAQSEAVDVQLEQVFQLVDRLDKLLGDFLDREGAMHLAALERPLRTLRDQLKDLRDGKVGVLLVPSPRNAGRQRDAQSVWKQRVIVAAMNKVLLSADHNKKEAGEFIANRLAEAGRPLPANAVRKGSAGDRTPGWRVVTRWVKDMASYAYAHPDVSDTELYRGLVPKGEAIRQAAVAERRDVREAMRNFVRAILKEFA